MNQIADETVIEEPATASRITVQMGTERVKTVDNLVTLTNQGDRSDFFRKLVDHLGTIKEPFDIRELQVVPRGFTTS